MVVTASDRAARALLTAYHHRRRSEGLLAWPTPAILDWTSFVGNSLRETGGENRFLLNPAQENAIWSEIIGRERNLATLFDSSRDRLAHMAARAQELLSSYAPRYLAESARTGWDGDAAAFSRWLTAFDATCRREGVLSPARAALELTQRLRQNSANRPSLLVAGFDRILPVQRELFDQWGMWRELPLSKPATEVRFYEAPDQQAELAACAGWCSTRLAADLGAHLLVIAQDVAGRRGEIERAFLRQSQGGNPLRIEFSLGVPLVQVTLIRVALSVLGWLNSATLEHEVDWLFSTGLCAPDPAETLALQAYMRALRQRGLARPEWTLDAFIAQSISEKPPAAWVGRMQEAHRRFTASRPRQQTPLEWSNLVPQILGTIGLPGNRALTSSEFQAWRRWQQALDTSASLGFDGRRIDWHDYLRSLERILDETLFAPESTDAPIQIAGAAESAGLEADAIWFLGTDEDAWPAPGSTNPLLPFALQREHKMPHSSAGLDHDLTRTVTERLLASANAVHFSYARHRGSVEARPSRLILSIAGTPEPLPKEMHESVAPTPITESFDDSPAIPFPAHKAQGGSSVLTAQSQCAFKAFATARLGAVSWEPAEAGLSAAQRGQILHSVMHAIWGGPPAGLRSLDDLLALPNLENFVASHVKTAMHARMLTAVRDRMPHRYLELEENRLTHLITEWLRYEARRAPFTVHEIEATRPANVAGLSLNLRLDRTDRLHDGTLLVIDYKTGDVSPKSWRLPRPDDVQLPLYAAFGLEGEPGGLLFARLRAGDSCFKGFVQDAIGTLDPTLSNRNALVKQPLTTMQLDEWRDCIERLAADFLDGRAAVNPRDYPKTCERCGLQTLCRVSENRIETEDDAETAEESDE